VITAISGIQVGHFTDLDGLTGCTVVLCPPDTVGSGEVRGGAPATRETDLLRPGMMVEEVNAILLTGGSAFGLAAADGVMRFLEERGIGFETPAGPVPIVPAASLFDLVVGDAKARPGPEQGYAACEAASSGEVQEGSVGAGTGATVAKMNGLGGAVKAGVGSASAEDGSLRVGALVALNAVGEVLDESGEVLAGARPVPGREEPQLPFGANTTIAVVATNARLSRERAHFLAMATHEGMDVALRPAHTMWDGDTVFSLATGEAAAPGQQELEQMAVHTMAEAIRRAVRQASSVPGVPSIGDLS
jgi:L-aminopeptidase/D-esterase-like protein